ncbi:MAG: extracellular solute-binding protein, partial [Cyanobacteria bacterium P01_H01_bin.130]
LLTLQAEAGEEAQGGGLPGWVPFVGRRETVPADLMLLGDRWLSMARQGQWIQPLEMALDADDRGAIADDRWRAVMAGSEAKPDGDAESDEKAVWGMPYRWGTTVLVYRKDRVAEMGGPITDWGDLWRSQLRGKVVLLNQAREVIGAALKEMGQSYNVADLEAVAGLGDRLEALHRQALAYTSVDYLQPLLMGDAWVAMGWSRDVLPVLPRRSQLAAVVPRSGSALWADLWVRPQGQPASSASAAQAVMAQGSQIGGDGGDGEKVLQRALRRAWVEFCWTPDIARRVTLQTSGASPQFLNGDWEALAKDQQGASGDRIRFPAADVLDRCEFLLPLSDKTRQQYQRLWSGLGQET